MICTGTSYRMLGALADAVGEHLRERHKIRTRIEGAPQNGWLLADFGDVVLHMFSTEQREYYRLEELWSEGRVIVRMQ